MALRYVSNTGSNGASGTYANPWQTPAHAQSASSSGDTIYLKSGQIFPPFTVNKSGITWDVYDGSAKAIISGFVTLTNWINQGNGIWKSTNGSLNTSLKKVTIDAVHQSPGKFIKFNETDHGFLTISNPTSTSVTNTAIGTAPNFVGGQITFKSTLYTVDLGPITAQSGNTISFNVPLTYGNPDPGYGFIISNHINTLTQFGEWSYDAPNKTVTMYFGAENPNSYTIKASASTNCILSSGQIGPVLFNNIIFEGSNSDAIEIEGSNTFTFDNITVRQAGGNGLTAPSHQYLSVSNSHFHDINNNGCWTTVGSSYATVDNCLVENVGLDLTLTKGGLGYGGGYGLHIPWGGSSIKRSTVRYTGGIGIRFEKAYSECSFNHVHNIAQRFADLGGIYNWNGSTNLDKQPGMKCIGNHVHDMTRSNQGTPFGNQFLVHGIYYDDHSAGATDNLNQIYDNVVYNIEGNGFNFRNVESLDVQRNLAFNCDQAIRIVGDQSNEMIEDLTMKGNVFVAKEASKNVMGLYNNHGNMANWVAVIPNAPDVTRWNNNVIARPIADTTNLIVSQNLGSTVNRTLANWKSYLGWDANSTGSPVAISDVGKFRLETNYSASPTSVLLNDGTYVDMYGVEQSSSITIPAYGGKLLIRTSDIAPAPTPTTIAIKEVYEDGFNYGVSEDTDPVIPAIIDRVSGTSQMADPTFVTWDVSLNAARFYMEIISPTLLSTYAGRTEHDTGYPHLKTSEETWFSASYYVPLGEGTDPLEEVIYQWHAGSGSPTFALWRRNSRFIVFLSLPSRSLAFDLGPVAQEIWYNFVFKMKFADDLTGNLTCWLNGELARCYNPNTFEMWVVPTAPVSGISSTFILGAETGEILQTVIEDGNAVSVLVYDGITSSVYPNPDKYPKWGFYKSGWGDTRIDSNGNVRPGVYDSQDPIYVAPENREKIIFIKNVNFETRVNDFDHQEIYTSLDVNNSLPLEEPVWWIDGDQGIAPSISILTPPSQKMVIYPSTVNFTVDITNGTNAIQKVEYFNNAVLIGTSTTAPYNFDWVNPTAGVKDVYAVVTDINNLTGTSETVTITVYNFIDVSGDFRMFLNVGTNTAEVYNGETYVGELNYYEGQSLVDNVSPNTTEPIFLTGRAYYNLNYSIPVPNGTYTVKTYHNEPWHGVNDGLPPSAGKRVFDIFLEGNLVYNDFDIYVVNNNQNTILTFEDINVTDGFLDLDLVASQDMANLSALEIQPYTLPNQAPVAVATSNVNSGDEPLEVIFTGDQSTDDAGIASYLWDFKDGNTSNVANPTHTFWNSGEYNVSLRVTDAEGLTSTANVLINVNEVVPLNEPPVAFIASDTTEGTPPLTVNFVGSGSTDDDSVVSYLWDFGDGSANSTEVNPSHIFTANGLYAVTLTVTDAEGLTDSTTMQINVHDETVTPGPSPDYIIVRGRFIVV